MKKNYSETRKKSFLNDRVNEYCLFLKGVNANIALNHNLKLQDLSVKLAVLPLCKAIGINYSINFTKFNQNNRVDLEMN